MNKQFDELPKGLDQPTTRRQPRMLSGFGGGLAAMALAWCVAVSQVTAQTFTVLHRFTDGCGFCTNSDGALPRAGLIVSGNTLYGTTTGGGLGASGTLFAVDTDGTGFTSLHSFTATGSTATTRTNSDGEQPRGGLILSGKTLYGTAGGGGLWGQGTVFSVNTDGSGFTNLHNFTAFGTNSSGAPTNSDGRSPVGNLVLCGNTLYGTTMAGGTSVSGTVFRINTDGSGFTNLYNFSATSGSFPGPYTNTDGRGPLGGLTLSGNTLYGVANSGGLAGNGTLFAVNTDGTGFTVLHTFTDGGLNSDGAGPAGGLVLLGNTLYGTASGGGAGGNGTVFAVNTDGTGFTTLYSFTNGRWNSDGAGPAGGLLLLGNTFYGTASGGGAGGFGTVFAVNTDGTGFTTLYSFTGYPGGATNDGGSPVTGLALGGNTLYGTTPEDGLGSTGGGTIFSISIPPRLAITSAGPNAVLSWPTNFDGLTLQSTTNLGASAIWTTNFPAPVPFNGLNTVTTPISGALQFFRLAQ